MEFEEIYEAYFKDVYLYTKSFVADKNVAEEMVLVQKYLNYCN